MVRTKCLALEWTRRSGSTPSSAGRNRRAEQHGPIRDEDIRSAREDAIPVHRLASPRTSQSRDCVLDREARSSPAREEKVVDGGVHVVGTGLARKLTSRVPSVQSAPICSSRGAALAYRVRCRKAQVCAAAIYQPSPERSQAAAISKRNNIQEGAARPAMAEPMALSPGGEQPGWPFIACSQRMLAASLSP